MGTGKSTVAGMFKALGAKVIDADKIVHQLMSPEGKCFREIVRTFSEDILTRGRIDRKKLGSIVFKDSRKLVKLEMIVHPAVREEIRRQLKEYSQNKRVKAVALDVPLLLEANYDRMVDLIVVVKTSRATQIRRAMKHLHITQSQALRRLANQMPLKEKIRLADIIIDNDGTKIKTKKQVREIWQKL